MTEMASVLGSAATQSTPLGLSASLPVSPPNRFALAGARVLASHMPKGIGPIDRDGFATVDMLVDDGRIAEIAPSGVGEFGEAPLHRSLVSDRPAAVHRRPYPSRQGAHLAARA